MRVSNSRASVGQRLILLIGLLPCLYSNADTGRDAKFDAIEEALNVMKNSDATQKMIYEKCVALRGDGQPALTCFASMMIEIDMTKNVCANKKEEITECYSKQQLYADKYANLGQRSGGMSPMVNAAANVCVDLHAIPLPEGHAILFEYVEHFSASANGVASDVDDSDLVWFDYELLFLCTEETYKEMAIRQFQ